MILLRSRSNCSRRIPPLVDSSVLIVIVMIIVVVMIIVIVIVIVIVVFTLCMVLTSMHTSQSEGLPARPPRAGEAA